MTDRVLTAAAVDLGASHGRVVLGSIGPDRLDTMVVHDFVNQPRQHRGHLRWDLDALLDGTIEGLAACDGLESIGVDSWAVDYGLLDADGRLLRDPVSYRDGRTDGVMDRLRSELGDKRIYDVTGLQFLPFNTLYQLASEQPDALDRADTLLLIPDLVVHRLTGAVGAERTNASTTQFYDATAGTWANDLLDAAGLPKGLLPDIHDPGTSRGRLLRLVRDRIGDNGSAEVRAIGSHDTASAVAAVPAEGADFAYISCGTWSLVGVELREPVISEDGRVANFTNEVGVNGTIRYLRNVMGLWPLQECLREWPGAELGVLLNEAAALPRRAVIDAEDADLIPPGGMPDRIRDICRRSDQPVPESRGEIVRCILDSLAVGHAKAVDDAERLSGQPVDVVHMVGGGSRNELLAQLTAEAAGRPVIAGPAEATALGNLVVQAWSAGVIASIADARALIARTQPLRRYTPRPQPR